MSNIFPLDVIPEPEAERPVTQINGIILANKAWHCRHDDLWPRKAGDTSPPPSPDQLAAINLYLGNFCRPVKSIANEVHCVACNALLTMPYGMDARQGLNFDPTSPTLEGRCTDCGYPVRSRHLITLLPPNQLVPVVKLDFFPMCYHPKATQSGLLN